ncbi:AAA family ATPase [Pseudomonas chlororaphis]|uniref:AAA family ATPase n=1 Tax=Pseudomonas chlororaphis TaxID=587753 RepID=UPI001B301267|nr:AAA family ATPase [Pseudomonas chlororaphis]QTT87538.1 AAA family ATPase [Pseudomonas chlororaphis]
MFTVVDSAQRIPAQANSRVFLLVDNWDDWFKFRTTFRLIVFDPNGARHVPGSVKIGQAGLRPGPGGADRAAGTRTPTIAENFESLDPENFFSLGQDEDYYATLSSLPQGFGSAVLRGLCDCAFDLQIFDRHHDEEVMGESLLRAIQEPNVRNRLNRLAHGNAVLTRFEFEFTLPAPLNEIGAATSPTMQFQVIPNAEPPTNLHVLVGRNGVGKTRCVQSIINTLLERDSDSAPRGELRRLGANQGEWTFSGLVSVSFSAFDSFELPTPSAMRIPAVFVGLRSQSEDNGQIVEHLKNSQDLANDFVQSLERCQSEPRRSRWLRAVASLATDPLFAETGVEQLIEHDDDWSARATRFFRLLSSGHAIVLLTTTRLVELVDERTLVVLDEPEGHLHPPLLSAFIRAVADLLVARNGVALISTHSPVVLQEVPRCCVWMLRRSRTQSAVERPSIETFGESVGILTREVFGLEVTDSGFHQLVSAVARQPGRTYEAVEQHFGGQLGAEARALSRSLTTRRDVP